VQADENHFPGSIETVADLGEFVDYHLTVGSWLLRTKTLSTGEAPFTRGESVDVYLNPDRCIVVPA